jgi:hypothetical protein
MFANVYIHRNRLHDVEKILQSHPTQEHTEQTRSQEFFQDFQDLNSLDPALIIEQNMIPAPFNRIFQEH